MNTDHLYETETMAELCARQGRIGEAITIYRELISNVTDVEPRTRFEARLAMLESAWQPLRESRLPPADIPLPEIPGTSVLVSEDQLTIAWSLPKDVGPIALEVLALQRSPSGIEVQKKVIPLPATSGRMGLELPGLHSAIAAAGILRDGGFVPIAFPR
jgi:hypothetical protein